VSRRRIEQCTRHTADHLTHSRYRSTKAILDAMAKDSKTTLSVLRVDGGMTNSDLCMQLQSDVLGISVERPQMRESTALGSAICAGVALGLWGWSLEDPSTLTEVNTAEATIFKPQNDEEDREIRYEGWNRAVERSRGWKNPTFVRAKKAFQKDEVVVSRGN
jgi:glycerol kinase